ncbi:hypothetical protein ACFVJ5_13820 [Nocardia sp. NPDC127606]|uniref:hypothetical protein n=1 Tax=Nocardia sp. NPDC127606 TaxID=3345406 RepID=UPI003631B475
MPVPPLVTKEQVREFLAEAFPTQTFSVIEFNHGWVCRPELSPEQKAAGQGLGQTSYVLNKQTGIVTVHPSLHPWTIGETYDQAIETGQPVNGRQIYPKRRRAAFQRLTENSETITYQVTVTSLINPPEPTETYQLTFNKRTLKPDRRGSMDSLVISKAQWLSRRQQSWPTDGTIED